MDNLRVGLVGYGRFGKVLAQAWNETVGVQLVSVCVGDKQSEEEARKLDGVEVFADYDQFLSRGGSDIVDVASPNYLHFQHATKAIEAGKHLQLEKPIAITIEDARRLLACKKGGSSVQVGFQYRFAPFWKRLKYHIAEGTIGSPGLARIEEWRGPFRSGVEGWRYDQSRVGHQFLEGAVHYFDLAAWFFGMPESVWGFTDSVEAWAEGKFGSAMAVMEYATGMKVVVGHSINGVSDQTIVSIGGEGAMIGMMVSQLSGESAVPWIKIRETGGAVRSELMEDLGELGEVRLGLQAFVNAVRDGKEPPVTLEDGFNALALDLAAIEAIRTGREMRMDGFRRSD